MSSISFKEAVLMLDYNYYSIDPSDMGKMIKEELSQLP